MTVTFRKSQSFNCLANVEGQDSGCGKIKVGLSVIKDVDIVVFYNLNQMIVMFLKTCIDLFFCIALYCSLSVNLTGLPMYWLKKNLCSQTNFKINA